MKHIFIINPAAGKKDSRQRVYTMAEALKKNHDLDIECMLTKSRGHAMMLTRAIAETGENVRFYACGGDGTLMRFADAIRDIDLKVPVYFTPAGTGNDFLRDVRADEDPLLINKYIVDLPRVIVNGEEHVFVNGIGYGLDGYCCEVGDRMRAESKKKINYTSIAIKGLLFHYHPTNATIIVDGKEHKYKKVWLAPMMNGRFYGGGMMPSPNQDRLSEHGEISVMVMHGSGKLKTLMIFPSIFSGKHIEHKGAVEVISGSEINVKFDRPTALQIDGETIKNVTEYSAFSRKRAGKTLPEFERI